MPDNEPAEHHSTEVFVNDNPVRFPTDDATGTQIKAAAGVPADYSLYLRAHGNNEPIADSEEVELQKGEHFFSRPPSNVS